jgi:hypothetical protein
MVSLLAFFFIESTSSSSRRSTCIAVMTHGTPGQK